MPDMKAADVIGVLFVAAFLGTVAVALYQEYQRDKRTHRSDPTRDFWNDEEYR